VNGELAGVRTQDQRLKRAMLYQLSYELTRNYQKISQVPAANVGVLLIGYVKGKYRRKRG
jgi:hypothetical protein